MSIDFYKYRRSEAIRHLLYDVYGEMKRNGFENKEPPDAHRIIDTISDKLVELDYLPQGIDIIKQFLHYLNSYAMPPMAVDLQLLCLEAEQYLKLNKAN